MNLRHAFLPNKFYPHTSDESQLFLRKDLLEKAFPDCNSKKKLIIIEAQAGQGKTTCIHQYLKNTDRHYCWHNMDDRDTDPVLFLTALYQNLTTVISGFESPELARIINAGAVDIFNLHSYANILFSDLDRLCKNDIYLVFDDIHWIEKAENTIGLLDHIIEVSPPKINFILSSRRPVQMQNRILRNRTNVAILKTADLSMDASEIEMLFENIFDRTLTVNDAQKIRNMTDGWVMGVILAAVEAAADKKSVKNEDSNTFTTKISHKVLSDYFQNEISTHIPEELQKTLLKLSLFNELPVDLAVRITGMDDLGEKLDYFYRSNFFIYRLDKDRQIFHFHHLFKEYLHNEARKQLRLKEIRDVYSRAAGYYLEQKKIFETLACYFHAGEFEKMDNLLYEEGVDLLAKNLNNIILSLLNRIPEEILYQYGWLSLFAGILGETTTPQRILPQLEAARKIFIEQKHEVGELLTLAQLIYYHFVVSGLYKEGSRLLGRAEELFQKNGEHITDLVKILAARNLAAGFCFFNSDMAKAELYATLARNLATEKSITNFIASSRFVLGYIALFSGNRTACQREAEYLYSLLPDPIIGMQNRLSLIFMQLDDLTKHGDYDNFFNQVEFFKSQVDMRLIKQTIAAPFLYIYQSAIQISAGEFNQALENINEGFTISEVARTAHMNSQLLQWRSYIHALLGNKEEAQTDILESAKLREIAGGHFHTTLHLMIKAGVYIALDQGNEAEGTLAQSLQMAEEIPSPYLISCVLLHRAFLRLKQNQEQLALQDLGDGLKMIQQNNYTFLWSWEPGLIKKLLTTAVVKNVEREFARELARKRLDVHITDDGAFIPRIYITLLDGFTIRQNGKVLFTAKDITEKPRELLAFLLIQRHLQAPLSDIEESLWPDTDPKKQRSNIDKLLGRLRNTLSSRLQGDVKEHFLKVKKAILFLDNCSLDSEEFLHFGDKGLLHAQNEQYWQAGNCFFKAFSLWKGFLPSETLPMGKGDTYSRNIENKLIETTMAWSEILVNGGLVNEAIKLLRKVSEKLPHVDIIMTRLYGLYYINKNPLAAKAVLKQYAQALEKNGFSEDETQKFISDISNKYKHSQSTAEVQPRRYLRSSSIESRGNWNNASTGGGLF